MTIAQNVNKIQDHIIEVALREGRDPKSITLCAATKTQSDSAIKEAISAGITICGENRVQEMTAHLQTNTYQGCDLHFIGTLQSNKIGQVVGKVALVQSVSSRKLIEGIQKQAEKIGVVQPILLEVNVGAEASKSGFSPEELEEMAAFAVEQKNISLSGLMAIPPIASTLWESEKNFSKLRNLFIDISGKMSDNYNKIDCLSMGMSEDYPVAIANGATLVRVGTALFGSRSHSPAPFT